MPAGFHFSLLGNAEGSAFAREGLALVFINGYFTVCLLIGWYFRKTSHYLKPILCQSLLGIYRYRQFF